MKIGFIGVDNIGNILIDSFIRAQTFLPHEIIVSNDSQIATTNLSSKYPSVFVARHNRELVKEATCFFICAKPADYHLVLKDIKEVVHPDQIAISLSQLAMIKDLEHWLTCKVAKIIPRISNKILAEACLYILGTRLEYLEQLWIKQLLETISKPICVEESAVTHMCFDLGNSVPANIA